MNIAILGAGISGLSLAYFLRKKYPSLDITIIEKESKVGGVISSYHSSRYFFERGPHTFKASKSLSLLNLIEELGLSDQIITANPHATSRYIFYRGQIRKVPSNPLSFCFSSLTRSLVHRLFFEWAIPAKNLDDESVDSFIQRRLGKKAASVLFDALLTGIYAGDIKQLSIQSCFPGLEKLESTYGSLTKGFFRQKKQKKKKHDLITLQTGMSTLSQALLEKSKAKLICSFPIEKVVSQEKQIEIHGSDRRLVFDAAFCALPVSERQKLFPTHVSIPTVSLVTVNLGYAKKLPIPKGFGYLIPSNENQKIRGVIFDSEIFPQQNKNQEETRLTVMLGGFQHQNILEVSDERCLQLALASLKDHLHLNQIPDISLVKRYPQAIPQYHVHHQKKVQEFLKLARGRWPLISFLGNDLYGVSLNDCIAQAYRAASRDSFFHSCKSLLRSDKCF